MDCEPTRLLKSLEKQFNHKTVTKLKVASSRSLLTDSYYSWRIQNLEIHRRRIIWWRTTFATDSKSIYVCIHSINYFGKTQLYHCQIWTYLKFYAQVLIKMDIWKFKHTIRRYIVSNKTYVGIMQRIKKKFSAKGVKRNWIL